MTGVQWDLMPGKSWRAHLVELVDHLARERVLLLAGAVDAEHRDPRLGHLHL